MKDCKKIHPLLSLYREEALTTREEKRVKRHLALCADARKELEQFGRLRKNLGSLPDPKMPGDLHGKIMARLKGNVISIPLRRNPWVFPSGAMVAAGLMVFLLFQQNPDLRQNLASSTGTAQDNANAPASNTLDKKTAEAPHPFPMERHSDSTDQTPIAYAPTHSMGSAAFEKQKDEASPDIVISGNSAAAPAPAMSLQNEGESLTIAGVPASAAPRAMAPKIKRKTQAFDELQPAAPLGINSVQSEAKSLSVQQNLGYLPAKKESSPLASWSGDQDSLSPTAQQSLLADEDSFENVWKVLEPGKLAPAVDFTTQAVVFLEAGLEPTPGYAIRILQMEDKPDKLVVHWKETQPGSDTVAAQVVTYPWILQVIDKPSKPVTFTQDE